MKLAKFGVIKWSRKHTKVSLLILVPVFVVLAIMLFIKNMDAPAQGVVAIQPLNDKPLPDPYAKPGKYQGKYIDFTYPDHFKKIDMPISGGILEIGDYVDTQHNNQELSISVSKQNLGDDSAISYRKETKGYKLIKSTASEIMFTKAIGGSEATAFIQHGDLEASISTTSPYDNVDLTNYTNIVVNSLQWK